MIIDTQKYERAQAHNIRKENECLHTLLQLQLQLRGDCSCHSKIRSFSFFLCLFDIFDNISSCCLLRLLVFFRRKGDCIRTHIHIHCSNHSVPLNSFCSKFFSYFQEEKWGTHIHKKTHTHTHNSPTLLLYLFPWGRCLFPAPDALPTILSLPSPSLLPLVLSSFFAGFPPRILPSSI